MSGYEFSLHVLAVMVGLMAFTIVGTLIGATAKALQEFKNWRARRSFQRRVRNGRRRS